MRVPSFLAEDPEAYQSTTCLIVGSAWEHDSFFANLLTRLGWGCLGTNSWKEARAYLERGGISVAIADDEDALSNWQVLIQSPRPLAQPPKLIVVSQSADDALWPDLLDSGAYDLIIQPFQEKDLAEAMEIARLAWLKDKSRQAQLMSQTRADVITA